MQFKRRTPSIFYGWKKIETFKNLPQFSYLFNRNAFIFMVRCSCSQTFPSFALVHKNNDLTVPLFLFTKTNSKAPRYLSYLIKEDSHYKVIQTKQSVFPWELKMLKKIMQPTDFMHISMKKQRNSIFPWELENVFYRCF